MNRIEFVARRLCAQDGCHPDTPAIRTGQPLKSTPVVQVIPLNPSPAWQFYVQRAFDVLVAADMYVSLDGQNEALFKAVSAQDLWTTPPDVVPKELQAHRDMAALR